MNVSTISVPRETAIQKINDIEALNPKQRTDEDDALLSVFKAVRKHNAQVINIADAFRQTGLNDLGQPKLAIAQADWKDVAFTGDGEARSVYEPRYRSFYRSGKFWQRGKPSDRVATVKLPDNTFNEFEARKILFSAVPHIPAEIRPNFHLRNYHILFEVNKWNEEYPVDPFLLKRVVGNLFIVIAEWELTELEASLLGSMRGN
jgi:hypothetical protein